MTMNRVLQVPAYMKYHNQKTEIDGITFDSKKEAHTYMDLKMLKRAGEIKDFARQKSFELVPSQRMNGKVIEKPVTYKADFVVYHNDGTTAVIDCKGMRTPVYTVKRKLMLWIHKIKIQEI